MKTEIRVWVNCCSLGDYQRKPRYEDELALLTSFQKVIGNDRVQLQENICILISDFSMDDLAIVERIAEELRIPIICKADYSIAKSELWKICYASLAVEGDYLDEDPDGNPLNRFPVSLCPACNMPDENHLPEPFYVSAKQMLRRKQDGVPDEMLAAKRDIFHCMCGVLAVSERVKRILEVLGQPFISARVAATQSQSLPFSCWAIRPTRMWGHRAHLEIMKQCPLCRRPLKSHADMTNDFWRNRIILKKTEMPDTDFVLDETWFGDRTKRSAGFIRDVFVSGKLYDVLLRAKIRGLLRPQEFIAFDNVIPMTEDQAARPGKKQNWSC